MSAPTDPSAPADNLTELLAVTQVGPDRYAGRPPAGASGRLFGGQSLAQALAAAAATMPDDRRVHSLQSAMVRPGDAASPIALTVERLHDGRELSSRLVRVEQAERLLALVTILWRRAGIHSGYGGSAYSDIADPKPLPVGTQPLPFPARAINTAGLDLRWVIADDLVTLWFRSDLDRSDRPLLDQMVLTYLSDLWFAEPLLRRHATSFGNRYLSVSTVSHSVWFHGALDLSQWHAFSGRSPASDHGLGVITAQLNDSDGSQLAIVAQEALLRDKRSAQTSASDDSTQSRRGVKHG